MEALLFFAFIAFLVFPALMKGQKKGVKKPNRPVTRNLMESSQSKPRQNNAQWGLQNTSTRQNADVRIENSMNAGAQARQSNRNATINDSLQQLQKMQTLAARLAENRKKRIQTIQSDNDGTERNKSGISKASVLRGQILDLNRSRRNDWGARHTGDVINGKSILVVFGIILIALYILARLPN